MSDLIWYFPFSVWLASLNMTIFFKSNHFGANVIISFFLWLSNIGGSAGKESACNAGDLGSVPGLGRSPGEGKGYPLQYSSLENSGLQRVGHDWATFPFTLLSKVKSFTRRSQSYSSPTGRNHCLRGRHSFGMKRGPTHIQESLCTLSYSRGPSLAQLVLSVI